MAKKTTLKLWTLNNNSTEGTHFSPVCSGKWPALIERMKLNSVIFPSCYFIEYPDGTLKPLMG